MTTKWTDVIRHLRTAAFVQAGGEVTDSQLLERFLTHKDEEAFEALVRRHGPMVIGDGFSPTSAIGHFIVVFLRNCRKVFCTNKIWQTAGNVRFLLGKNKKGVGLGFSFVLLSRSPWPRQGGHQTQRCGCLLLPRLIAVRCST